MITDKFILYYSEGILTLLNREDRTEIDLEYLHTNEFENHGDAVIAGSFFNYWISFDKRTFDILSFSSESKEDCIQRYADDFIHPEEKDFIQHEDVLAVFKHDDAKTFFKEWMSHIEHEYI